MGGKQKKQLRLVPIFLDRMEEKKAEKMAGGGEENIRGKESGILRNREKLSSIYLAVH